LSHSISIVITAFNRNPQLHKTLTSIARQKHEGELDVIVVDDGDGRHGHPPARFLCEQFGARYISCRRPASIHFRNPSLPNNIGIRAASGDVVILQNAECCHEDPDTIQRLSEPVFAALASSLPQVATFAHVIALSPDGTPQQTYCSPAVRRPYFFCGAVSRELLVRLRGFDEDFCGAGYDDDDLAVRLAGEGCRLVYTDAKVHHQWHPPAGVYLDVLLMAALFEFKCAQMTRGELGTVRNPGGWGGRA
jgi:hypothetical protein